MPRKGGRFTAKETAFAAHMAATGDPVYARTKALLSQPGASRALQRPEVQGEIRRIQEKRLEGLLEKAINVLDEVLTGGTERGKLMAVKIVVDKTIGLPGSAGETKEAHEMTGDEIAAALARLRQELAARGDRAKDITPLIEVPKQVDEGSVFD